MTVATSGTTPVTRPEIEEAIRGHLETIRRMPNYWIDRRAAYHAKIDALLDQWEQAAA